MYRFGERRDRTEPNRTKSNQNQTEKDARREKKKKMHNSNNNNAIAIAIAIKCIWCTHEVWKQRLLDKNAPIHDFIFKKKINVAGKKRANIDNTNNTQTGQTFHRTKRQHTYKKKERIILFGLRIALARSLTLSAPIFAFLSAAFHFYFLLLLFFSLFFFFRWRFSHSFFTAHFILLENTSLTITALKCSTSRSLDIVSLDRFSCSLSLPRSLLLFRRPNEMCG